MNVQSLISKVIGVAVMALVLNQMACSNARFGATGGTGVDVEQTDSGFGDIGAGIDIIEINNGGDIITYSDDRDNIYVSLNDGCVLGLSRFAGDPQANQKIQQLLSLVQTSQMGFGTLANPGVDSIYLNIRFENGQTRTFNLRNDQASTSQQTLSNGAQIINFFDDISPSLNVRSCNNGKK